MGLNSPLPRDLTAERAAEQVIENWKAYDPSGFRIGHLEHLITTALKTARQEALREAARVAQQAKDDCALGRVRDAYEYVIARLDRLASEGG